MAQQRLIGFSGETERRQRQLVKLVQMIDHAVLPVVTAGTEEPTILSIQRICCNATKSSPKLMRRSVNFTSSLADAGFVIVYRAP
jgi:hypothetical protein